MIKINNLIEQIFSVAVALDQNGGLRNTIYAVNDNVLIMNYDHTVLLHFKLRKSENAFQYPVAFKANDYDSDMFEQIDNSIIFHTENEEFERKKICGTSDLTPEEVLELYQNYIGNADKRQKITISNKLLELLDDSLSHVEFSGEEGGTFKVVQRNIYSGGLIEIKPKSKGMFTDTLDFDFGPIGIKTDDLKALFTFQNVLNFHFPNPENSDFLIIESTDKTKRNMTAIVAGCLYDEIIEIKLSNQKLKGEQNDGRQKQKIRRSK